MSKEQRDFYREFSSEEIFSLSPSSLPIPAFKYEKWSSSMITKFMSGFYFHFLMHLLQTIQTSIVFYEYMHYFILDSSEFNCIFMEVIDMKSRTRAPVFLEIFKDKNIIHFLLAFNTICDKNDMLLMTWPNFLWCYKCTDRS